MGSQRSTGLAIVVSSAALALASCDGGEEVAIEAATTPAPLVSQAAVPVVTSDLLGTAAVGVPGTSETAPTPPAREPAPTNATTIPVVTSDIVGTAAAGNSGGIGEGSTDSYSETVRNDDGTCAGWAGRDVPPPWTSGLVSGASFVILALESDDVLGEGTLGTSFFENVGTERDQWVCSFPFEATIVGSPEEFRIQVDGLDPWRARRDPADPERFVASVNTVADATYFPECSEPAPDAVSEWQAVGTYWSDGFKSLCFAGLRIADIERPCRRPNEGSDYIVSVTLAADPSVVLEDATGVLVDVAALAPGEEVVAHVATGRPCG